MVVWLLLWCAWVGVIGNNKAISLFCQTALNMVKFQQLHDCSIQYAYNFAISCRNLKIAYFTQHHVDQLVMNVSALELTQSKYPGEVLFPSL